MNSKSLAAAALATALSLPALSSAWQDPVFAITDLDIVDGVPVLDYSDERALAVVWEPVLFAGAVGAPSDDAVFSIEPIDVFESADGYDWTSGGTADPEAPGYQWDMNIPEGLLVVTSRRGWVAYDVSNLFVTGSGVLDGAVRLAGYDARRNLVFGVDSNGNPSIVPATGRMRTSVTAEFDHIPADLTPGSSSEEEYVLENVRSLRSNFRMIARDGGVSANLSGRAAERNLGPGDLDNDGTVDLELDDNLRFVIAESVYDLRGRAAERRVGSASGDSMFAIDGTGFAAAGGVIPTPVALLTGDWASARRSNLFEGEMSHVSSDITYDPQADEIDAVMFGSVENGVARIGLRETSRGDLFQFTAGTDRGSAIRSRVRSSGTFDTVEPFALPNAGVPESTIADFDAPGENLDVVVERFRFSSPTINVGLTDRSRVR